MENLEKVLSLLNLPSEFESCDGQLRGGGFTNRIRIETTKDYTKMVKGKPTETVQTIYESTPELGGGYLPCGLNVIDDIIKRDGTWNNGVYTEYTPKTWFDISPDAINIVIGDLPYFAYGVSYWTHWKKTVITKTPTGCTIATSTEPFEPTAMFDNLKDLEIKYGNRQGLPDGLTRESKAKRTMYLRGLPELSEGTDPFVSPGLIKSVVRTKTSSGYSKWMTNNVNYRKSEILALTGLTEEEFAKHCNYTERQVTKMDSSIYMNSAVCENAIVDNKVSTVVYYNGIQSDNTNGLKFPLLNGTTLSDKVFSPGIEYGLRNDVNNTSLGNAWVTYFGLIGSLYPNEVTFVPQSKFEVIEKDVIGYNTNANEATLITRIENKPITQKGVQYQRYLNLLTKEQETYHKTGGKPLFEVTTRPFN